MKFGWLLRQGHAIIYGEFTLQHLAEVVHQLQVRRYGQAQITGKQVNGRAALLLGIRAPQPTQILRNGLFLRHLELPGRHAEQVNTNVVRGICPKKKIRRKITI